MDLYEIALGIEKERIRNSIVCRLTPWFVSLLALMAGIWLADACGFPLISPTRAVRLPAFLLGMAAGFTLTAALLITRLPLSPFKKVTGMTTWCLAWLLFGSFIAAPEAPVLPPIDVPCTIEAQATTGRLPGDSSAVLKVLRWTCGKEHSDGSTFLTRIRLDDNETLLRSEGVKLSGKFADPAPADSPGAFDSKQWLRQNHILITFRRNGVFRPEGTAHEPMERFDMPHSSFRRAIDKMRLDTHGALIRNSPFGIVPALALGVSRTLDRDTRTSFSRLGIAHVLAVSGLHFGLIAAAITWLIGRAVGRFPWLLRRLGRKRATAIISIVLLWLYILIVGAPVSAQRAMIMMYSCLLGHLLSRKPESFRNLAMAGTIILIIDPGALFSAGFQLSFAAVLGIACTLDIAQSPCDRWIAHHVRHKYAAGILKAVTAMMLMTVGSSVATAPFVAWHFGQLPLVGSIVNVIAVPAVSFVMLPLSLLAAALADTGLPGEIAVTLAGFTESAFVMTMSWCASHIPLAAIKMPPHPVAITILATTSALMFVSRYAKRWARFIRRTAALAALAAVAVSAAAPQTWFASRQLRISFLSVGQADSTLVEFPDGSNMLIDAGNGIRKKDNMATSIILPFLHYHGIERIDRLVLTHPDYDHYAAMPDVINATQIGAFWHNGDVTDNPQYQQIFASLQKQNADATDICNIPREFTAGGVRIERLWPPCDNDGDKTSLPPELETAAALSRNDRSIVLSLKYGNFSAMLMGDAGTDVETHILRQYPTQKTTLLKAGHHGSQYATGTEWLDAVRPDFVVFSAGKNNQYRFPHTATQRRCHDAHARMLRTDHNGTLQFSTDGNFLLLRAAH